MTRGPDFDELIGAQASGAEREQLRQTHELLLQAGPPPELTPRLRKAPGVGVLRLQQRRAVKRRALLLIAATVSIAAVFFAAGFAVSNHRGTSSAASQPTTLALTGTAGFRQARATLEVWKPDDGNWPMKLSVIGLPKLPAHTYYEVYLVRNGKPWGSCGTFRVASSSRTATVTLNAPYTLHQGDSWIVTRPEHGSEPGQTVLRPVSA